MDTFARSIDAIGKAFEIDITRINRDVMFEFGMAEVEDSIPEYMLVYYEAGEGQKSGKQNIVLRVIEAIKRFLRDLGTSISDAFKKDEDTVTIEQFLQTQQGQAKLSYDVEAIQAGIDDEILKGRKIIQAISKGTNVPDKVVADYVDRATNFVKSNAKAGGAIVSFIALSKIRQKVSENVFKGWEQKVDDIQNTNAGAFWSKFSMDDTVSNPDTDPDYQRYLKQKGKADAKEAKKVAAAQKEEKQKLQVMNAMSKMIHDGGNAIGKVGREVKGIYNGAKAKMNAKKKNKEGE